MSRSWFVTAFVLGATAGFVGHGVFEQHRAPAEQQQQQAPAVQKQADWQLPISFRILDKGHYVIGFDQRSKVASWVYERLTPDMLEHLSERPNGYRYDDDLPYRFQSHKDDFSGTEYTHGHLAAIGNYQFSLEARKATNVYSNIAPQLGSINSRVINQLEQQVRRDVERAKVVHVVTGPLYHTESSELRISLTPVNKAWIPTGFFKAWLVELPTGKREIHAFKVDHMEGSKPEPIEIADLERVSGVEFPFGHGE